MDWGHPVEVETEAAVFRNPEMKPLPKLLQWVERAIGGGKKSFFYPS